MPRSSSAILTPRSLHARRPRVTENVLHVAYAPENLLYVAHALTARVFVHDRDETTSGSRGEPAGRGRVGRAARADPPGAGARHRAGQASGRGGARRSARHRRVLGSARGEGAGRAADAARRHLPHLLDDEAHRLGRGHDAGRRGTSSSPTQSAPICPRWPSCRWRCPATASWLWSPLAPT